MKKENMVRTARSYYLEFKDEASVWKFLFIYKDLLIPYSEQTINEAKSADGRRADALCGIKGYKSGDWNWLRFGIDKTFFRGNRIKVHMKPSDFKVISGQFKRTSLRRGTSLWVFKGEL